MDKNMKYTPGPWIPKFYPAPEPRRGHWEVRQSPGAASVKVGDEILACGFSICNVVEQDMDDIQNGEEAANARLIAKSPEMVGLLKIMTNQYVRIVEGIASREYNVENEKEVKDARALLASLEE